jgi:hypothetical protein
MEIQIDAHTLERAQELGANEEEIKDVIEMGFNIPAKYGRVGKAKVYDFKQKRHGKIMNKREWNDLCYRK